LNFVKNNKTIGDIGLNKLSKLNKNIYVKIPITYTNGKYTTDVIDQLIRKKIKLNITAVFNLIQVKHILPFIKNTSSIISVFAGRIYDSGFDAAKEVRKIVKYTKKNSKCRILWASTRQVYDIKLAEKENCDIITVDYSIFKKIKLFNKHWKKFSLETVNQFYSDAIKSNFKI
jgi:transaldolase